MKRLLRENKTYSLAQSHKNFELMDRACMDTDDARLIAHLVLTGKMVEWVDYKGGPDRSTGEIIARVLRLEWTTETRTAGLRVNCAAGPGTMTETRAVKPAGKLDSLTTLLPQAEAFKMALALREHLQAWATATHHTRKDQLWTPEESEESR